MAVRSWSEPSAGLPRAKNPPPISRPGDRTHRRGGKPRLLKDVQVIPLHLWIWQVNSGRKNWQREWESDFTPPVWKAAWYPHLFTGKTCAGFIKAFLSWNIRRIKQIETRYPKEAFSSCVPQHHQVGVGQLPAVRHPQHHAVFKLCHPQLHVNLLVGVADVPGQLELPAWVEGHAEGHGERRETAGGGLQVGHFHSIAGRLIRSYQDDHQSGQAGEVHDGDVLEAEVLAEDPHVLLSVFFSLVSRSWIRVQPRELRGEFVLLVLFLRELQVPKLQRALVLFCPVSSALLFWPQQTLSTVVRRACLFSSSHFFPPYPLRPSFPEKFD